MKLFSARWSLIYTRPRHEKAVHSYLQEKQIAAILPTKRSLNKWHDRKKVIEQPLFPSYVFIYLKDIRTYHEAINANGFLYFVRSGKEIASVNETVINNIKLLSQSANEIEVSDNYFQPGTKTTINKGPLAGLACEVVVVGENRKLLVRVDLLQRSLLLCVQDEVLLNI